MATYISNQSGSWSTAVTWVTAAPGTVSPTAPAGFAPQSGNGDKFIIRGGHTVIYDLSSGEFGDQTSYYPSIVANLPIALSANAISLSGGTLKASRSVTTSLTARGTIVIGPSGTLDWGTSIDPLTTSSTIVLNYITNAAILSTSGGAAGIYMIGFGNNSYASNIYINGISKKRNTYLTSSATSGSNTIIVESVSGWNVGDKLWIQSETISGVTTSTGVLSTFITNINGLSVQISPSLNSDRSTGRAVSNFGGNVLITSYSRTYPSFGFYLSESTNSIIDINNIVIRDVGWSSGWYNYGNGSAIGTLNNSNTSSSITKVIDCQTVGYTHRSIAIDQTANLNYYSLNTLGAIPVYTNFTDICIFNNSNNTNYVGLNSNNQVLVNYSNINIFKSGIGVSVGSSGAKSIVLNNCTIDSLNNFTNSNGGNVLITKYNVNNCYLRAANGIIGISNSTSTFNNCYLEYKPTDGLLTFNDSAYGNLYVKECTINGGRLKTVSSNTITTTKDFNAWIYNPTLTGASLIALSAVSKYTRFNSFYYADSDLVTRKNGINSYRIRPELANNKFEVYEIIPAIKGNSYRIKGNLRFDSNYGTTNPPAISFVGAGINTTFTSTSAVYTWQNFDYTLSATSTDDIAVTITGQSTLTSGYVWLDGLPFTPMIQTVRWYGFNFDTNQYRTVNTLTTLTENQVSALDVVSNLDYLYDAANYWSITNPTFSSYIDLFTVNGPILDFGSRNITIDSSAGTGFSYASGSNTITIKSTTLSAGTNFNDLKTTGTITLANGASIGGSLIIQGNVLQATPLNLSNVTVLGLLSYNTNSPTSITYTNCAVTSATNTGSANVTIKKINSTVTYV
jgi:hypothetical protein